jgi:hypothetical protein
LGSIQQARRKTGNWLSSYSRAAQRGICAKDSQDAFLALLSA